MHHDFLSSVENEFMFSARIFEIAIVCYLCFLLLIPTRVIIMIYVKRSVQFIRWAFFLSLFFLCVLRIIHFLILRFQFYQEEYPLIRSAYILMEQICETQGMLCLVFLYATVNQDLLIPDAKRFKIVKTVSIIQNVYLMVVTMVSLVLMVVFFAFTAVLVVVDITGVVEDKVFLKPFVAVSALVGIVFIAIADVLLLLGTLLTVGIACFKERIHVLSRRRRDLFFSRTLSTLSTSLFMYLRTFISIAWIIMIIFEEFLFANFHLYLFWIFIPICEALGVLIPTFLQFFEFGAIYSVSTDISRRFTSFSVVKVESDAYAPMVDDQDAEPKSLSQNTEDSDLIFGNSSSSSQSFKLSDVLSSEN